MNKLLLKLAATAFTLASVTFSSVSADELAARLASAQINAELGDVDAMVELAQLYQLGLGTPVNLEKALAWYHSAANKGHAEAAYQLGYAHYWGKGVKREFSKAHSWFLKAAEGGYRAALPYLSKMYALGQGVVRDKKAAQRWSDALDVLNEEERRDPLQHSDTMSLSPHQYRVNEQGSVNIEPAS